MAQSNVHYQISYSLKLSDPEIIVGARLYEITVCSKVLLLAVEDLSDDARDVLIRNISLFDEIAAIPMFQGLAETVQNGELWKTTEVAFSDNEMIELMSSGDEVIPYKQWRSRLQSTWRWKNYGPGLLVNGGEDIRMLLNAGVMFGGEIVYPHEAARKAVIQTLETGRNPCGEIL